DPLVHHGRHIGRSIYAFANINRLLTLGVAIDALGDVPSEEQERLEYRVYKAILKFLPPLDEALTNYSPEQITRIAALLQKGSDSARSDDTKGLKKGVIEFLNDDVPLDPYIHPSEKSSRGFAHPRLGQLLCPISKDWNNETHRNELIEGTQTPGPEDWPLFLFENQEFNREDVWAGFLKNEYLVQAYLWVFICPTAARKSKKSIKATKQGNAHIHGMTSVTIASIVYIATQVTTTALTTCLVLLNLSLNARSQVRFALTNAEPFSRSDRVTDSQSFYQSLYRFLDNPDYHEEVDDLLKWWNRWA
ncbi:hypothetical protein FA15DRAFT_599991, partial [Coprinopsis marcescibilis]